METIVRTTKSSIKAYMVDRVRTPCGGVYATLVRDHVWPDRFGPLQIDELPAIVLYAAEETSDYLDQTQDRRHLKIQIEIQAYGDDADTQLDLISDQVVDLFRSDEYLGGPEDGLVEWCRYVRGQLFYDERRHVNGVCWMIEFDVRYIASTLPDPAVARLAPFGEMDATYAWREGPAGPPVQVPCVTDRIVIPQD